MGSKGASLCQWADCPAESQWGIEYCRVHRMEGRRAEDWARDIAIIYGDGRPDAAEYWAAIDADPKWKRRWWEPRPRQPYRHISLFIRRKVAERYGCAPGQALEIRCPRCGAVGVIRWEARRVRFLGLHVDHITPVAHGGRGNLGNLQLLCPACNIAKGARVEA